MSNISTQEKNKEIVRALYHDILNHRKWESLDRVIAPEYAGIVYGKPSPFTFLETVQGLVQGFPDIQWTVEDLVAEGDRVTVRWTWHGTHQNSFRGFPATHKPISDNAIAIYQLKEGKVTGAWIQTDRLGFLQQIGAVPETVGVPQPVKPG